MVEFTVYFTEEVCKKDVHACATSSRHKRPAVEANILYECL